MTGYLEDSPATLVAALARSAARSGEAGVTVLGDDADGTHGAGRAGARSYRALLGEARRMAGSLAALGVAPGERVVLVLPTGLDFVRALFAVQMAGAIPVPSYPPTLAGLAEKALARLTGIVARSGATWIVTDGRIRALLGTLAARPGVRGVLVAETLGRGGDDASGNQGDGGEAPATPPAGDAPALIQFTSGSTGAPKGVVLSHAAVLANVHAMGVAVGADPARDSGVVWLPLYHDMGLIGGLLFCVYWGIPVVLLSPLAFVADPLCWIRAMSDRHATLSPAPNFAYALAARRAATLPPDASRDLDLSAWRVAFNGAEPVSAATLDAFITCFGRHGFRAESMLPVYGLAESALAVTFPEPGRPPRVLHVDRAALAAGTATPVAPGQGVAVVGVGRALPGHRVEVVDAAGRALAERRVGAIVASGPSVMAGYHDDPDATAAVLDGGRLATGDLGFVDAGDLFVVGRSKALIIVRGENHHAEDLERIAAGVAGVRPGGVVAFAVRDGDDATERVVLVCETREEEATARAALARAVAQAISAEAGLRVGEVVLARPGVVPKTPSGKPEREETRRRYLAGTLGAPPPGRLASLALLARSAAGHLAARLRRR